MDSKPDRIVGTLIGSACGDALGAGYKFTHPGRDDRIFMKGGGLGWEPGQWTDDTEMMICVAEEAALGDPDPTRIGDRFLHWLRSGPNDVGVMTAAVLGAAATGADLPAAAEAYCRRNPRCAGNGSLMRTAPVALAHLGDREGIAELARRVSDLTHGDPLAGDACVLWCLAIDRAIADAVLDVGSGLAMIPADRRDRWHGWITEASESDPWGFTPNGFVVTALQAALSAVTHTPPPPREPARHLADALVTAVRIGHDTDTVAAIAGSLLGARWGASAVPDEWREMLHGWPGYDAGDLRRLALAAGPGA
jgi:ADP-ribosylglycohydrolase